MLSTNSLLLGPSARGCGFRFCGHEVESPEQLLLCVFSILLMVLASCGSGSRQETRVSAQFDPRGVYVTLHGEERACRFWVADASGHRLLDSSRLVVPTDHHRFIFRWQPGERYHFGVFTQRGHELGTDDVAPSTEAARPRLCLCLPYTSQSATLPPEPLVSVAAVAGTTMTLTAFIENTFDGPLSVTGEIVIPQELHVVQVNQRPWTFAWTSRHESERWHRQIPIQVPRDVGAVRPSTGSGQREPPLQISIRATATWTSSGESWATTHTLKVIPQRPDQMAETIRVTEIIMPADPFGRIDRRYRPDALILEKPVLNVVRRLLGTPIKRTNLLEPASYQSVVLENRGEASVNVLVSGRVVDTKSGAIVPALSPPDLVSGGTRETLAFATLPARSQQAVVLPLFLDWRQAIPGLYQRRVGVRLWGADRPFFETETPFELIEPSRVSAVVLCCALLLAAALILLFCVGGGPFLGRFRTRELVFVALFATMVFSTVTVPTTILANVAAAIVGPFNVLVTGLLNEVIYYALLVAFLALVPKPGAIAVLLAVGFLLNGLVLGQLSAPGVLYTATHLSVLEAACFLGRLTSRRSVLVPLARGESTGLWWPAVILGAADAFLMWVDYLLAMQLYRLFYSTWYLVLSISVDGFLYTFLGVHLGARVGRHLGRIAP